MFPNVILAVVQVLSAVNASVYFLLHFPRQAPQHNQHDNSPTDRTFAGCGLSISPPTHYLSLGFYVA